MHEQRDIVKFLLLAMWSLLAVGVSSDNSFTIYKPPGWTPPCSSEIYCHGELLHTIQMSSPFKDSKTFVDMKMKQSPSETLALFRKFMNRTDNSPSKDEIARFVNETFDPAGSEFEDWVPMDWKKEPKFLSKIRDNDLKKFASDLNEIWKLLGRKMKDDVRINEEHYSIIYVPNPVIVPGGRFREFYYWDSYWILKGLLLSEMYSTVRGMLSNFVSVVDKIGFIPNGGRIYYSMRSQLPMLIPMVKLYVDATDDWQWVDENLWLLDKEFAFWMTNRTVEVKKDGQTYTLARYYETSNGPRPESYSEDYKTSMGFRTEEEKDNYYQELKTAAESGWDFSSRWFINEGTNKGETADKNITNSQKKGNLTHLKTRYIIPVDLNAIIYRNAILLAEFHEKLGNSSMAEDYRRISDKWRVAVDAVLWHEEVGAWLDYDILNDMKRDYFYPTNVVPLWTNCYDLSKREYYISRVMKYLEKTQFILYQGGIPTSFEPSGEQWDYPNAWPPLQDFVIMSLDNTGDQWAQRLAYELSERWVRSNYKAFNTSHSMFEKYDATLSGGGGGGGEYDVQLGFGWSNGLVMDLINKYADSLTAYDHFDEQMMADQSPSSTATSGISVAGQMTSAILALIISIAVGYIGTVVYKRRHYSTPSSTGIFNPRATADLQRKHIAYTELRDMSNED